MIERVVDRGPEFVEFAIVDEPPGALIDLARDSDFDAETVAMQTLTFMPGRNFREAMRGFETIFADESDLHVADPTTA